jgi:hypothetical protein
MHLAFAAALLSHTLYHVRKVVVHHKDSRPSLRNPQVQLLINPVLPRVQSNKPQPCWARSTSPSPWSGTATNPVRRLWQVGCDRASSADGKSTRHTSQPLLAEEKFLQQECYRYSHGLPHNQSSSMSSTGIGHELSCLGDKMLTNIWGLRHLKMRDQKHCSEWLRAMTTKPAVLLRSSTTWRLN